MNFKINIENIQIGDFNYKTFNYPGEKVDKQFVCFEVNHIVVISFLEYISTIQFKFKLNELSYGSIPKDSNYKDGLFILVFVQFRGHCFTWEYDIQL